MSPTGSLDRIDRALLAHLQKEGRLSNKELAARVGLAASSCLARVQRLERDGTIVGYRAEVRPEALGVGLEAMVTVRLARAGAESFDSFRRFLLEREEVVELLHVGGAIDLLARVAVRDTEHLRTLVLENFSSRPEVDRLETAIVFEHAVRPVPTYAVTGS